MVQSGHALQTMESCASAACQEEGGAERDRVYKEPMGFPEEKDAQSGCE